MKPRSQRVLLAVVKAAQGNLLKRQVYVSVILAFIRAMQRCQAFFEQLAS